MADGTTDRFNTNDDGDERADSFSQYIVEAPTEHTNLIDLDPAILAADRDERTFSIGPRDMLLVGFAMLIVVALLGVITLFSPLTNVDHVDVIGADVFDLRENIEMTVTNHSSSMLLTNTELIERQLMENPHVATASIRKQWPSTIEVRVTERIPTVRLVAPHGTITMSTDGTAIDIDNPDAVYGVRDVYISELPDVEPAEKIDGELQRLVGIAASIPLKVAVGVAKVEITPANNLLFILFGGERIIFGDSSDASQKFTSIVTMMGGRVDLDGLCQLDVTHPHSPRIFRTSHCTMSPVNLEPGEIAEVAKSDPVKDDEVVPTD